MCAISPDKKELLTKIIGDVDLPTSEVVELLASHATLAKKLTCNHIANKCTSNADLALLTANLLLKDAGDPNPSVRSASILALSALPGIEESTVRALTAALSDQAAQVWLCIIASILLMSPIICVISHVTAIYRHDALQESLGWCAFNLFRNIVVQGNFLQAKSHSKRLFLIIWFLSCVIFSALYSGMLTAVFAAPAFEEPIDSLDDLPRAVKEGFTIGIMEDTSTEYFFKAATEGSFKRTWDLFNHEDRSKSFVNRPEIGLTRVMLEKFVFINVDKYCYAFAMRYGEKKFHFGRDKLLPVSTSVACQEGSPFKDIFNRELLRFREVGLVSKWLDIEYRKIRTDKTRDKDGKRKGFSVTIADIQASFYIVFLGYGIGMIAILVENINFFCSETSALPYD